MWFIEREKELEYFKQLQIKVAADINRIPDGNPFEVFSLIEPQDIKVVMIGQDPYSTGVKEGNIYKDYYDGIAFSSKNTVRTPASLSVLKALFINSDLKAGTQPGDIPNDLRYLVKRGVFLCNTLWTVSRNKPNSHNYPEWITFSSRLVNALSLTYPNIVFILFGSLACELIKYINPISKVLTENHPAADKYKKTENKLIESNILVEANKHLKEPIKWTR